MANLMASKYTFYSPYDSLEQTVLTNYDTSLNCFSWATFTGNTCTFVELASSGTVNYISQNFDDITAPILFFISLIETLFFLFYFLLIKNYNNNSLYL